MNLILHVGYDVHLSYDQNLKGFLIVAYDNGKYESIIRVEKLLIKERNGIEDS